MRRPPLLILPCRPLLILPCRPLLILPCPPLLILPCRPLLILPRRSRPSGQSVLDHPGRDETSLGYWEEVPDGLLEPSTAFHGAFHTSLPLNFHGLPSGARPAARSVGRDQGGRQRRARDGAPASALARGARRGARAPPAPSRSSRSRRDLLDEPDGHARGRHPERGRRELQAAHGGGRCSKEDGAARREATAARRLDHAAHTGDC